MEPKFRSIQEKKFAGKRLTVSFIQNRTPELWRAFMPRRREIADAVGSELYSIEIYPTGFFDRFDPSADYEKWAAVEVNDPSNIPDGLETMTSPAGLYAVFIHRGPASEAERTYRHIFETWLPASGFILDDRPHFAVMDDKYSNDSPESEEEIWVPVAERNESLTQT